VLIVREAGVWLILSVVGRYLRGAYSGRSRPSIPGRSRPLIPM
jgi:hypothetical protein